MTEVKRIAKSVADFRAQVEEDFSRLAQVEKDRQREVYHQWSLAQENERNRERKEKRDMEEIVKGWGAKVRKRSKKPPTKHKSNRPSIMPLGNSEITQKGPMAKRMEGQVTTQQEAKLSPRHPKSEVRQKLKDTISSFGIEEIDRAGLGDRVAKEGLPAPSANELKPTWGLKPEG